MLFGGIIAVCLENRAKHTNTTMWAERTFFCLFAMLLQMVRKVTGVFRRYNFVALSNSAPRSEGRGTKSQWTNFESLKLPNFLSHCSTLYCEYLRGMFQAVRNFCTPNYIYLPSLSPPLPPTLRSQHFPVTKSNRKHLLHLSLRLSWYLIILAPSILFSSFALPM